MVADGFFGLCGSESRDELLMGTWYPPPPSHLPCPPSLISRMWLLWTLSNVKEEARNCQLVRELLQGGQKSPSSHLQEGILPTAVYRRPLLHHPVLCTGARSFVRSSPTPPHRDSAGGRTRDYVKILVFIVHYSSARKASTRSGMSICGPRRLSEVFLELHLKPF